MLCLNFSRISRYSNVSTWEGSIHKSIILTRCSLITFDNHKVFDVILAYSLLALQWHPPITPSNIFYAPFELKFAKKSSREENPSYSDYTEININENKKPWTEEKKFKKIKRSRTRYIEALMSTCEHRECKTLTEREKARFMLNEWRKYCAHNQSCTGSLSHSLFSHSLRELSNLTYLSFMRKNKRSKRSCKLMHYEVRERNALFFLAFFPFHVETFFFGMSLNFFSFSFAQISSFFLYLFMVSHNCTFMITSA